MDFGLISSELYNQDVIVFFKHDTECFRKYGSFIEGILAGRTWREDFEHKPDNTHVTSLIIKMPSDDELFIACHEVENIEKGINI